MNDKRTTSFIWSLCRSSNLAKSSLEGAPCAGRLFMFREDIILNSDSFAALRSAAAKLSTGVTERVGEVSG